MRSIKSVVIVYRIVHNECKCKCISRKNKCLHDFFVGLVQSLPVHMMLYRKEFTGLSNLLVVVFWMCLLFGCQNDEHDQGNNSKDQITKNIQNKIMPLGASRVQGFYPWFESYRYYLWKDLIDGGWDFDYIGTEMETGSYPNYKGLSFDTDHQGKMSWTSKQIFKELESILRETGYPDIVLFSSPGGNDILNGLPYENVIENINGIIDIFQNHNPDIVILIEQLAPGKRSFMTQELTAIFEQAVLDVDKIAQEQTKESSQVIAVNMFDGFSDGYLYDDIHYNEQGAEFIAQRYYEVLETVLE